MARRWVAWQMMALAAVLATCTAQALTDTQRARLGIPPGAEAEFSRLGTSPRLTVAGVAAAPDILALDAAHLGLDRLLLKATFAAPPDFTASTFIFYLDLDNDPASGRKDDSHRDFT